MLLIAEKINTINKKVSEALAKKDRKFFEDFAVKQLESKIIDALDLNIGSDISVEPENMKWVVKIIESVTEGKIPLSIDSPNPDTIIAGFEAMKNKKGAFINSISLQSGRYEKLLPLAKEYDLNIIALPIEKSDIPNNSRERSEIAQKIATVVNNFGIPLSRLYIDCLVTPIAISTNNALVSIDTLKNIKKNIPECKTIICVAGISFGIPNKETLNSRFLTILAYEGIDAILMDPFDRQVMDTIYATNLILDKDEFCMNYLKYSKI